MSYWDTSTLVKLYANEPDSPVFISYLQNATGMQVTSEITLYEARATFQRKEAVGAVSIGAADQSYTRLLGHVASGALQIIKLDSDLQQEYGKILHFCYRQIPPLHMRTLDAIHLASAKLSGQTEVVTTDLRMRDAVKKLGYTLFPP